MKRSDILAIERQREINELRRHRLPTKKTTPRMEIHNAMKSFQEDFTVLSTLATQVLNERPMIRLSYIDATKYIETFNKVFQHWIPGAIMPPLLDVTESSPEEQALKRAAYERKYGVVGIGKEGFGKKGVASEPTTRPKPTFGDDNDTEIADFVREMANRKIIEPTTRPRPGRQTDAPEMPPSEAADFNEGWTPQELALRAKDEAEAAEAERVAYVEYWRAVSRKAHADEAEANRLKKLNGETP